MRVNIAYSVELDEVPQLTKKLLSEATKNLETLSKKHQKISHQLEGENENKALKLIDECRKLMATADHCLADCYSLLSGYQQTIFQLQSQDKEKPEEGVSDDTSENG
jgi:uncharacterized protein